MPRPEWPGHLSLQDQDRINVFKQDENDTIAEENDDTIQPAAEEIIKIAAKESRDTVYEDEDIESIEWIPADESRFTIIENTMGEWVDPDDGDETERYYSYYPPEIAEDDELVFHYKNGESVICHYYYDESLQKWVVAAEDGEIMPGTISYYSGQEDEHWGIGEHEVRYGYYTESFSMEFSYPVTIIENPIESIEYLAGNESPYVVKEKPKTKAVKKRKANVTWQAAAGASGYEIQYSAKKNFKKAVTITVKGGTKKKATLKLKKIKPKKKCFVRIRPFTMVKNTKGQQEKVYGAWTKTMKIKVK